MGIEPPFLLSPVASRHIRRRIGETDTENCDIFDILTGNSGKIKSENIPIIGGVLSEKSPAMSGLVACLPLALYP